MAVLTSYAGQPAPIQQVLKAGAGIIGLRMFDRHAFVDVVLLGRPG